MTVLFLPKKSQFFDLFFSIVRIAEDIKTRPIFVSVKNSLNMPKRWNYKCFLVFCNAAILFVDKPMQCKMSFLIEDDFAWKPNTIFKGTNSPNCCDVDDLLTSILVLVEFFKDPTANPEVKSVNESVSQYLKKPQERRDVDVEGCSATVCATAVIFSTECPVLSLLVVFLPSTEPVSWNFSPNFEFSTYPDDTSFQLAR